MERRQQHFLLVTYPAQGHVNPALHLAKRLARTTGSRVTFSTAISGHRRMFPSLAKPDEEVEDGLVSYIPYSDGYDDGYKATTDDVNTFMSKIKLAGSRTVSTLVQDLAARDRPVSCLIYTLLMAWAADVARDHGVPSALYWIQTATVFATYYHYFHGYDELITSHSHDPAFTVNLPGLLPLQIRDLPSFFTNTNPEDPYYSVLAGFRELFEKLDREEKTSSKPRILMNTFDALETDAIKAIDTMELIAIGPLVPFLSLDGTDSNGTTISDGDLFEADNKGYMEWLDSQPERSVVYVSFGSISLIKKQQLAEISWGLEESGRPFLWVVRKDNRGEGVELEDGENGMVVEWCSQVKVLSHPSVGCFVTHCGWNSTLESLACGVPTVGVPQWTDQATNARLAEAWGTGVRGELSKEGVLEGKELKRCVEVVMGEGERGMEIRRKAEIWRDRAREAVRERGSSEGNLRNFVDGIASDQ
ncbi:crocetin glucosyltransferase, chloroplastic-like [Phoenix dactylifera]|uniref:Glycosyltransferase n=1 Tax=Phoenix dactylifera TaxID=42345 RepID=A0A8B7C7J8_PHODC|nr:crocetin glucosyltransferase, chloroplastic-like [Phoenix dactylifera]